MPDVGLKALETIHKLLCIDEPWTIRGERDFSWIGHRLTQNVRASKAVRRRWHHALAAFCHLHRGRGRF